MEAMMFAQADEDFYAPLALSSVRGTEFRPTRVPEGWSAAQRDIWTQWHTGSKLGGVEEGWKIHVSARLDRAAHVLDACADVFFAEGVPFKHMSCSRFFIFAHHKHAARQQSGKFCVAYPPDVATARRLMQTLKTVLAGEEGPYVLTDRRFDDSPVVYYRYGSYVERSRVRPDGTNEHLVRDGAGRDVPDRRGVGFALPDGITDPFARPEPPAGEAAPAGPVRVDGYLVKRAIRHSNGGGTYEGLDEATGRRVFIKEARAHNGLTSPTTDAKIRLRSEYETLRALHERHPGICPEPLSYYRGWEHEFLITEFVEGRNLYHWMATNNPLIWPVATPQDFRDYYDRCQRILDALGDTLRRMHEFGYVFVDLNPHNIMVDDEDRPRLVDFEVAGPLHGDVPVEPIGAPGYFPLFHMGNDDRLFFDEYGLSAVALGLIAPLNTLAERNPHALAHLRYAVESRAEVPEELWRAATRFRPPGEGDPALAPEPADVAAQPVKYLTELRDGLVRGLLDTADPDNPDRVVPLGPRAYTTNALCVAHGLAGVVHALGKAAVPVPAGLLDVLSDRALERVEKLPPGLHVGSAGIAWVLADHGRLAEARTLLEVAYRHPVLAGSATLDHGRAGVALSQLALFGHTGDQHHLYRALELRAAIPDGDALVAALGPHNAVGLMSGRTGIALLDYYLGRLTGDHDHLERGRRLLHDELDRAEQSNGGLLFPVSDKDTRSTPYLQMGSAGFGMVASRYLSTMDDDRLTAAMPGLLASATSPYTVYGGLYSGIAGLGLFLIDHARRYDHEPSEQEAFRTAGRLFMYTAPRGGGIHLHGEHNVRLSSDLHGGSAGALLFLDQLLEQRTDVFFTLDALIE